MNKTLIVAALLACFGVAQVQAATIKKTTKDAKDDWTETVSPAIQKEISQWKNTQTNLRPIQDREIMRYPQGYSTPSIVCSPVHVCMLRLQAREKISTNGITAGDTARWNFSVTKTGSGETETQLIVVRPVDVGISTNMLVSTDRHVYNVILSSVDNAPRYDPLTGFYYPDETVAEWSSIEAEAAKKAQEPEDEVIALPNVAVDKLDFAYDVTKTTNSPWINPERVLNDGSKTYIVMPKEASAYDLPTIVVIGPDGKTPILVNSRFKGGTFIVDRLFDVADLILVSGDTKERVTISRKGIKQAFCLFGCR